MSASLKLVAPSVFDAAVEVNPAAIVTPPPSAICIASSPSVNAINGVCNSVVTSKFAIVSIELSK